MIMLGYASTVLGTNEQNRSKEERPEQNQRQEQKDKKEIQRIGQCN
jgi:hypothetical protein